MGEPAGTGRVDADVRGSDLRSADLCAVPEQKPGIYAKRRCRLCDSAVSGGKGSSRRETFDSLSGENPRDFHGRYEERDNEISEMRKEDVSLAYYGCHTDITIPYDELGSIRTIDDEGDMISIIEDGRFVLPGTEALNEPFGE